MTIFEILMNTDGKLPIEDTYLDYDLNFTNVEQWESKIGAGRKSVGQKYAIYNSWWKIIQIIR